MMREAEARLRSLRLIARREPAQHVTPEVAQILAW
jgi:hypothetical protein